MDAILALRIAELVVGRQGVVSKSIKYSILIDNLTWHILILSQHLIQLTG